MKKRFMEKTMSFATGDTIARAMLTRSGFTNASDLLAPSVPFGHVRLIAIVKGKLWRTDLRIR